MEKDALCQCGRSTFRGAGRSHILAGSERTEKQVRDAVEQLEEVGEDVHCISHGKAEIIEVKIAWYLAYTSIFPQEPSKIYVDLAILVVTAWLNIITIEKVHQKIGRNGWIRGIVIR